MTRRAKVWLIVSGVIPLLGLFSKPPGTALLIYSLFVLACLGRRHLRALADRLPGRPEPWLVAAFLLAGSLTEFFAWLNNYLQAAKEPALFHPQLFPDLLVGLGFYGGWAAAWLIALRRYRFTLAETFLVTGIQGIFFEQLGAVFVMMVMALASNPLQALIFGLYVCAIHGSAVGLPMAALLHRFEAPDRSRHWSRFPVVIVLMVGFAFLGAAVISLLAQPFGGLPPKRSITEYPFW